MTWTLQIYDPTGSTLLGTVTDETATELDGGFRIGYAPTGEALKLECTARNDLLGVPPRGVLRWTLDGAVRFHGIVPDPPSLADPNLGTVLALGGREALRVTLMDGAVYRSMGVYQIVRDILARLCPPCLTHDPTLIGDGSGTDAGPGLDTFYSPTADLVTVLDALAKSAGVTWAAGRLGRILFGHPSTPLTIPYQGSWRRLPVQGRETVTQAALRVVSAPSGLDSAALWNVVTGVVTPYLPRTVTVTATHPEHVTYHAHQAVEVPDGVSVLTSAAPTIPAGEGTQNLTNPSAAIDGNPSTYASGSGLDWRAQYFLSDATSAIVLGFRITYGLALGDARVELRVRSESALSGTARNTVVMMTTLDGADSPVSRTIILPPDARHGTWQAFDVQLRTYGTSSINIHEVVFFVLDEDAAQRVAESYLQVPFSTPAEIVLDGVYDPTDTVTITGTPDGDVTGPVASWELRHLPDGTRQTRIQLGATDESRTARAIKWAVMKK